MKFLARRLAHALLLLLCVSALALALLRWAPGDYFTTARVDPRISPEALTAMRAEHGLDRPLPVLYWKWVRSVVEGDWGFSFAYDSPAGPILWPRLRNTLLLVSCATLLAWIAAVPAGIAAAQRAGRWPDLAASAVSALLLGVPEIVLALAVFLAASRRHFLLPGINAAGEQGSVYQLLPPAVCLAAALLPLLISHLKSSVRQTLEAPFVEAARSFGIPEMRVLLRWALPAALNPMISLFGLSIGLLISSSLIVEGVFSWPGLGQLMLQAVADRDVFLIVDSAVLAAAFLVAGNLCADVLLYLNDPRIRAE